jgi:hypothetical protein
MLGFYDRLADGISGQPGERIRERFDGCHGLFSASLMPMPLIGQENLSPTRHAWIPVRQIATAAPAVDRELAASQDEAQHARQLLACRQVATNDIA